MANRRMNAIFFLCDVLRHGRLEYSDIAAIALGKFTRATLTRAANTLGVKRRTRGFGSSKHTIWHLEHDIAEKYRSQRIATIAAYRLLERALKRAAVYVTDNAIALLLLEDLINEVERSRRKLEAKSVDNSHT